MEHPLAEGQGQASGLAPGHVAVAHQGHMMGSALDLRTSSLLDPAKILLHGENMRRRGSDISRVRPVITADVSEEVELETLSHRRSLEHGEGPSAGPSLADLESAVDSKASIGQATIDVEDVSVADSALSPAERKKQRRRAIQCFAALCWSFFMCGWNDGSTGPLLPTIQAHYQIGFAIAAMLFVSNTVGYMIGATANVYLHDRLGFGRVIVLGASVQVCAYGLMAPGGPFPLMCFAFACIGFAQALQTSNENGFVGSLKEPSTKLGLLHAAYGLGAFSAPLVATQFAKEQRWSFHYLISLGVAVLNVVFLSAALRFKNQEELRAETGEEPSEVDTTGGSKYRQMMGISSLHLLTCWALIYVGVEVTLGGWIVTFIQQKRGGGTSSGYISSGFFGGLMAGRVVLLWLNRKIGERRVMFIYTVLAIALEVTIWIVPSLIENALAVSVIGLLLGPMYPILVHHSQKILPRWLFTSCVGWIAGVGQTGSAILPFITGLLASRFGIASLQPFVVSMMSTLLVIWAFVPRMRRVD